MSTPKRPGGSILGASGLGSRTQQKPTDAVKLQPHGLQDNEEEGKTPARDLGRGRGEGAPRTIYLHDGDIDRSYDQEKYLGKPRSAIKIPGRIGISLVVRVSLAIGHVLFERDPELYRAIARRFAEEDIDKAGIEAIARDLERLFRDD